MIDVQSTARCVDLPANRTTATLTLKLILILLRSDAVTLPELVLPGWRTTGTALFERRQRPASLHLCVVRRAQALTRSDAVATFERARSERLDRLNGNRTSVTGDAPSTPVRVAVPVCVMLPLAAFYPTFPVADRPAHT